MEEHSPTYRGVKENKQYFWFRVTFCPTVNMGLSNNDQAKRHERHLVIFRETHLSGSLNTTLKQVPSCYLQRI